MAGVYISFPFCAQKCTYCNFASGVFPRELQAQYMDALEAEIRGFDWAWRPETVYIGGGTPSRLEAAEVARLFDAVPGRPWREATIEVAPGDVTEERARGWRDAGITRVSLGVQSFVQKELAQTGRKHTAAVVEMEVARLRAAGFDSISIDLIAGLPFQTVGSFRDSVEWAVRLGVPHVSVYMLEVDTDSRLGGEMLLGGVRYGAAATPSEEAVVEMYESARVRLAEAGIARYEISNFARPGFESLHNLKYWRREPYVGFGADAHSFDGVRRWQNAETAAEYVARAGVREYSEVSEEEERFFVGLRLSEGIAMRAGDAARLEGFVSQGLVEIREGRARLTDRGVLYSNEVFEEFVNL